MFENVFGSVNIFVFIGIAFLLIFILGHFIEVIRVPWIFSALVLGALLAIHNPFSALTNSNEFNLLANLGQYFLLFVIGFEINLKELKKHTGFILKATTFIIGAETVLGALLFHFLFHVSWLTSVLLALAFATVGEAVLTPILDEFKLINTRLGQLIIGIGTLDDVVEVAALMIAIAIMGSTAAAHISGYIVVAALLLLAVLGFGLSKMKEAGRRFGFANVEYLFLFTIFILFLFTGIGDIADSATLGALVAGISMGTFIPSKRKELIKNEVKAVCYGLFAPLFLFKVGTTLDVQYLIHNPVFILIIGIATTLITIIATIIISRKELTIREAVMAGLGVSVRFSTSTIIFFVLYQNKLITSDIYSILIATSVVVTFVIPIAFATLVSRWHKPALNVED